MRGTLYHINLTAFRGKIYRETDRVFQLAPVTPEARAQATRNGKATRSAKQSALRVWDLIMKGHTKS